MSPNIDQTDRAELRPQKLARRASSGPDDMYPPPQTSRPLSSHQLSLVRALPLNNVCVECENPSQPDWASVTYGTVICLDCAGAHRGLGVHLSFVRSLTMDDWTDEQYQRMVQGGNGKWNDFWQKHVKKTGKPDSGLAGEHQNSDPIDVRKKIWSKYESNAARAYRENLSLNAQKCRSRGNPNAPSSDPMKAMPTPISSLTFEGESRLEEELPPSLQDVLKALAWPFSLSQIGSKKSYFSIWGVLGLASAYGARYWGLCNEKNGSSCITSSLPSLNPVSHGYMGAAASNDTNSYYNLFAMGILLLTVGIPYVWLRRCALNIAHSLVANRQDAFKSARNLLMDRINVGRAQRLKRCDVFYPPVSAGGERRAACGLIFYPGAMVDRTAYAPIASRLSELGILVAVANLEPYRMVARLKDYAVREEVMHMLSDSVLLSNQGVWSVDEWAIGGHSVGGDMAIAAVANEFSSTMKKVVLWGVSYYPDNSLYPCKRKLRDIKDVDALVVNGSNDEIIKSMKHQNNRFRFEANMPPRSSSASLSGVALSEERGHTYHVTIEGGNHAGCAHYGPQMFPLSDGIRTITLEQQQRRMAEVTVDFLLSRDKRD